MTKWLDRTIAPPGGGRAASGGSFYHVSFRSGSRAMGSCALSAHDYITREGEYGPERDRRARRVRSGRGGQDR